jgi:hypothetical protein
MNLVFSGLHFAAIRNSALSLIITAVGPGHLSFHSADAKVVMSTFSGIYASPSRDY